MADNDGFLDQVKKTASEAVDTVQHKATEALHTAQTDANAVAHAVGHAAGTAAHVAGQVAQPGIDLLKAEGHLGLAGAESVATVAEFSALGVVAGLDLAGVPGLQSSMAAITTGIDATGNAAEQNLNEAGQDFVQAGHDFVHPVEM